MESFFEDLSELCAVCEVYSVRAIVEALGIDYTRVLEYVQNDPEQGWSLRACHWYCRNRCLEAYFQGSLSRNKATFYIKESDFDVECFLSKFPTASDDT